MKKLAVLLALLLAFAPTGLAFFQPDGVSLDADSIVFEGATEDAYETTIAVTDATADRTITIPDSAVTLGQPADDSVDADALADADLGDVSVSSGVVSLDASTVAYNSELPAFVPADSANQACDTTCGVATAVVAYDAGTNAFVATDAATADSCICNGAIA